MYLFVAEVATSGDNVKESTSSESAEVAAVVNNEEIADLEKLSSKEYMQLSAAIGNNVDQQSKEDLTEIVDTAYNVLDDIFLHKEHKENQGHGDQDKKTKEMPQTQVAAMEEDEDEQLEEDPTRIVKEVFNVLDDIFLGQKIRETEISRIQNHSI